MAGSIKIRMVDTDRAHDALAEKVRQVVNLAANFAGAHPPNEQNRFYMLRMLCRSLRELEDYRSVVQGELDL